MKNLTIITLLFLGLTFPLHLSAQVMFSELDEALAHPNPEEVTVLTLNFHYLDEFPTEILKFSNLEVLNLGFNNLTSIPNDIKKLSKLQELHLNNNKFTTFPTAICQLKNLT